VRRIAERVCEMVIDTYGDNLGEREEDGAVVVESLWKKDMVSGIERIISEETAAIMGVVKATLGLTPDEWRDVSDLMKTQFRSNCPEVMVPKAIANAQERLAMSDEL
jgi:hypothetical protein